MTKSELRNHFRNLRQVFVSKLQQAETDRLSADLASRLGTVLPRVGTLGSYAAIGAEVDPEKLLTSWRSQDGIVALPYFENRESPMEFRRSDGTGRTGPFGIRQPSADAPAIVPDTILVPLIAADRHGNRIGQGKGHYDRYLSWARREKPILSIGLAWECQLADTIPIDSWDEPLDYICTPETLIRRRK